MRTIILGFDSFDPLQFERLNQAGKMPNLGKLVDAKGYSRLEVCSPPQTEVSWTCIATGTDPGSHGVFDFVHRDPVTYAPYVSLLPTRRTIFGEEFLPPYTTKTFFQEAAEMGYPATAMWWPALFPARPEIPVATIPGLGTPDIRGQLGVGTYLTSKPVDKKKSKVGLLTASGKGRFSGVLEGPQIKSTPALAGGARESGTAYATQPVMVEILAENEVRLMIGKQELRLEPGKWSPIFELVFPAGFAFSIHAITQVIVTEIKDGLSLYFLPLQIHPLHSVSHYGTPSSFIKDSWKHCGPFLTLGWPQDTNALEDGCISDEQFLDLCDLIFASRKRLYFHHLGNFREGVLAGIFDCLDRVQHMFLHDQGEVVDGWYLKLDEFVGQAQAKVEQLGLKKHRFLTLSDHGFRPFDYKVHLNRWLVDNHFMQLSGEAGNGKPAQAAWDKTKAYALGLNSLYLNVAGREGQGIVEAATLESLLDEMKTKLLSWTGPNGQAVISRVLLKHEVFSGPYTRLGPDIVIGYAPGYRASSDTGLGKIPAGPSIEANHDHWGADHCIDAAMVPGVLFANRDLSNIPGLSFRDIPFLAIGKHLDQSYIKPPSKTGAQGQKDVEERLKGLGYL
jgi:predicted AlkP superfamily phosphohydrolase/phosphomutase